MFRSRKLATTVALVAAGVLGVAGVAIAHDYHHHHRHSDHQKADTFGFSGLFAGADGSNYQHDTPDNSMGDRYHYRAKARWDGHHWSR
jgi:hypothetical protein